MELNKITEGDCIEGMKQLPDNSIDCCITSPPYFGLRDYGHDGQIGLEETPEMFVAKMVEVFNQVKRVLKPTGTLWLNLGDSYNNYKANTGDTPFAGNVNRPISKQGLVDINLKSKDLIGVPWMVAFALRSSGWYLRQDIIWNKPNAMPESVTDRCTKAHEYIFLLSKSNKYYYDAVAIKTPLQVSSVNRYNQDVENQAGSNRGPGKTNGNIKALLKGYNHRGEGDKKLTGHKGNYDADGNLIGNGLANKRSVWTVTTKPFSEAHFATFPEDLIVDCIKAGSSEHGCCANCGAPYVRETEKNYIKHENWYGDKTKESKNSRGSAGNSYNELVGTTTVGWKATCKCDYYNVPSVILDPFMGAGTTALVASKLGRDYIGFELNPKYIKIANKRLYNQLGMFNK